MKILLIGCTGQVGWELKRSLAPLGPVFSLSRQGACGIAGDLSNPDALEQIVKRVSPDVVVNAAAYTAVDRAEEEPEIVRTINAQAPAMLARAAKAVSACLVHYSTDYVFDGSGTTPWQEDDLPAPLNVYGCTKLEGEQAIQKSGCQYLVLRTSWIYSTRGKNFIQTILRLAAERHALRVVKDQIGAPTGADLIADATAHIIRCLLRGQDAYGIYHLTAAGETSWFGFARLVLYEAARLGKDLRVGPSALQPISSQNFPTVAARPYNSRLDTSKVRKTFDLHLPGWEQGVVRAVEEIVTNRQDMEE